MAQGDPIPLLGTQKVLRNYTSVWPQTLATWKNRNPADFQNLDCRLIPELSVLHLHHAFKYRDKMRNYSEKE